MLGAKVALAPSLTQNGGAVDRGVGAWQAAHFVFAASQIDFGGAMPLVQQAQQQWEDAAGEPRPLPTSRRVQPQQMCSPSAATSTPLPPWRRGGTFPMPCSAASRRPHSTTRHGGSRHHRSTTLTARQSRQTCRHRHTDRPVSCAYVPAPPPCLLPRLSEFFMTTATRLTLCGARETRTCRRPLSAPRPVTRIVCATLFDAYHSRVIRSALCIRASKAKSRLSSDTTDYARPAPRRAQSTMEITPPECNSCTPSQRGGALGAGGGRVGFAGGGLF